MKIVSEIENYWGVQPPHKNSEEKERFSLDWYREISKHRYSCVPYMKEFVGFENYAGKRVLEIGCGAGSDLAEFARHGAEVVGLDVTDIAIEMTRKRFSVEGLEGTFLKYDGESLPADIGSFDAVYSWGVLHHTPRMDDIMAEAHTKLKSGGELIMMLYNRLSILYYYSILYLRKYKAKSTMSRFESLSRFSEYREGCPYTKVYSTNEIKEILWYFSKVDVKVDYPVYDDLEERKIIPQKALNVEIIGVPDLDAFLSNFNRDLEAGEDLRKYGWHLVLKATK